MAQRPRIVIIGGVIVAFTWLLLAYVQLAVHAAALEKERYEPEFSVTGPDTRLLFERDSGAGRPFILTSSGSPLLEYSDWDDASQIIVDDQPQHLFLHPQGFSVDDGRGRIYQNVRGDGWELLKEVQLTGSHTATVDFYFIAHRPDITSVRLSIGHWNQKFSDLAVDSGGFNAVVDDGGERYSLRLAASDLDNALTQVDFRLGAPVGGKVSSVVSEYTLSGAHLAERTLLGTETLTWSPAT